MALINYITQIQFDFGAVATVGGECARVGISRPLICTDRGIVAAGLLQPLNVALGEIPAAVYDGTRLPHSGSIGPMA
jgi:4-hydroxybutyrate dehydrogenase